MRNTGIMTLAKGQRLRVTRLDACGRVNYGDSAVGISKGFVSVGATANTTSTDEINVPNANGDRIIFVAGKTSLSGYGIEIVMAEVDPEIFSLVTGQRVIFDVDGNAVGFAINTDVDLSGQGFALEVWAGATGGNACDDESATGSWGYFLFPFLQGGVLGDHSIENGGITFTLTGISTTDGNHWEEGPYPVTLNSGATPSDPRVPGPLLTPLLAKDHLLIIPVSVAPPVAIKGTRPLLDPSNVVVASVTATAGTGANTRKVNFAILPDPAPGVGAWYEFGDGTWDYVETAADDIVHTYAAAGVYNYRVSTNGTWVTGSITLA